MDIPLRRLTDPTLRDDVPDESHRRLYHIVDEPLSDRAPVSDSHPRRAVVLMPLFSLRGGGFGVGEIPDLPRFARWAASAGFKVVQLLPVGAVCGGETSPYAAASAFALDPVYLGLDDCEDFRLAGGRASLTSDEQALLEELNRAPRVRWGEVGALKARATRRAFARFQRDEWATGSDRARALARFIDERRDWLADYALFSVLHDRFGTHWQEWEPALRDRQAPAIATAREELREEILYRSWLQWQLDLQWHQARAEGERHGVALMGDLPFVVATDSADVWCHRDIFHPELRVGTPPDAFSADGQDWGLPLYDWEAMAKDDFAWMRARAARAGELYALYRVDHVIGLYRTFYRTPDRSRSGFVPAEEPAQVRLGETIIGILAGAGEVVAEDLGMVPPFLRPSLTALDIPGYRVLRWEKDDVHEDDEHTIVYRDPADWPVLSVAASGTHDIETNAEWYDALTEDERAALAVIPGLEVVAEHDHFDDEIRDALLRVLYGAPSELVAVPFQDALGTRERVNVPGTVTEVNWTYRMPMSLEALAADQPTITRLTRLSKDTGRE
jgi:4-alpha-glucanotransferase